MGIMHTTVVPYIYFDDYISTGCDCNYPVFPHSLTDSTHILNDNFRYIDGGGKEDFILPNYINRNISFLKLQYPSSLTYIFSIRKFKF